LARERRIAPSRAAGIMDLIELIGAGSFSRIAEATVSALLPSKARRR
jgi:hypothetical protein